MKRKAAGLALVLAMVLALPGCGAMTPEKLAAKVKQAVEENPYSQAEMEMIMETSVADPTTGIEMDVGLQLNGQMRVSYEPDTLYEKVELTIEMMGLRMPTEVEIYILPEGDKTVSYTNIAGSWLWSEVDPSTQASDSISIAIWDLPPEQLAINEEVTELEGAPAACLTGQVTGEEIANAVGFLFNSMGGSGQLDDGMLIGGDQDELDDIDWEKVSAQVTTYVDPETYLPLREEITFSGLEDALSDMLGGEEVSFSLEKMEMSVDYTSYEPVDPCVLPEGAKAAADQSQRLMDGDPDNGDGTFTIQESGYYVDVTAPEGYELDMTNYDEVDFYSEELDRLVCYQMWRTSDSNDLFFWDMVSEEETLYTGDSTGSSRIEFEVIPTENYRFCLDGYTYQGEYAGKNYYAWVNLDDQFYNWVLVRIYDGGSTMDSSITREELVELLEQVHPYQPLEEDQGMGTRPEELQL